MICLITLYLLFEFGIVFKFCNSSNQNLLLINIYRRNVDVVVCSINRLKEMLPSLNEEEKLDLANEIVKRMERNNQEMIFPLDYLKYGILDDDEYYEKVLDIDNAAISILTHDTSFFTLLNTAQRDASLRGDLNKQVYYLDCIFFMFENFKDIQSYSTYIDSVISEDSPLNYYRIKSKVDFRNGTKTRESADPNPVY
jgi:hypothetical protein